MNRFMHKHGKVEKTDAATKSGNAADPAPGEGAPMLKVLLS
jgi:hypothetical protein